VTAPSSQVCLGDLVTLVRGTTYKSALLGRPGPVLLGLASIQRNGGFRRDNLSTYGGGSPEKLLLVSGDMYVSLKDVTQTADLLGAVSRVPTDVVQGRLTQDTVKLVFKSNETPKEYIYWLLRTPQYREYCLARSMGTTNLSLSREDFLSVPVPELTATRSRIVQVLEAVDDKIELNRRMNETLEEMARALFKSWFVDFDPVRAKAEARQPAGMDAATAALFPDSFEDSELGLIPAGWRAGSVGDIAAELRTQVIPDQIEPGTPYIGLEHMPRRSISLSEWGESDDLESAKFRFSAGDILFGKLRPYFHKVGVAVIDGVSSTDIVVMEPKSEAWLSFLLCVVSSEEFVGYTDSVSTGTKMPRTSWRDMARYRVALPIKELAASFDADARPLLDRIRTEY
jgi:type I restriction enzyme S subunit